MHEVRVPEDLLDSSQDHTSTMAIWSAMQGSISCGQPGCSSPDHGSAAELTNVHTMCSSLYATKEQTKLSGAAIVFKRCHIVIRLRRAHCAVTIIAQYGWQKVSARWMASEWQAWFLFTEEPEG